MSIILTPAQADRVRGISPTNPNAAIDPIPYRDGTFAVGEEVLADPDHADVRAFLETLPKRTIRQQDRYGTTRDPVREAEETTEREARQIPVWSDVGVREPINDDGTVRVR